MSVKHFITKMHTDCVCYFSEKLSSGGSACMRADGPYYECAGNLEDRPGWCHLVEVERHTHCSTTMPKMWGEI